MGEIVLCTIEQYKYLGLVLNEFLDFYITAQVLSDAANRALVSIINKYKAINELGYYTYTRLFQSGVCLILDYGIEIWGFRHFEKVDSIKNKAIRISLGFTGLLPLQRSMGTWVGHIAVSEERFVWFAFGNRIINLDPQC